MSFVILSLIFTSSFFVFQFGMNLLCTDGMNRLDRIHESFEQRLSNYKIEYPLKWGLDHKKRSLIFGFLFTAMVILGRYPIYLILIYFTFIALTLFYKKRRYIKTLKTQLEDLIPFIYSSLKAGITIERSIQSASEKFPLPASKELESALQAQYLGIAMDRHFYHLSQLLRSQELSLLAFAMALSQKTGTPLSHLLESMYKQILQKRENIRKIKSMSSQGTAQGYVAMLLPIVFTFVVHFFMPNVFSPLMSHPLGKFIFGFCALIMICASIMIYKITHLSQDDDA